ncbi:5-hydroxytryptamine receptor 4-like [Anneissia japonica]|uniref:5-hydroxytryptamine receptor 4-like n=1 Tax=Anneissia japonica TaxID=1529436 RepID=UPI00142584F6|nr:5-hydroxytryptamine receptor 4-like [Anneissia japonica]XP_033102245.1 5-hydroxytryptamine receptor 4-like [Anneissia japonica]
MDEEISTTELASSRVPFSFLDPGMQVAICLQVVILIIIGLVGLFGNTLTIIAIVRTKSLRITTNYFLANLAIADILICVIIDPFYIVSLLYRGWPLSGAFCKTVGAITCLTLAASVINLLAISVNRYYCIVRTKLYASLFNSRRTVMYCLAIWGISFLTIVLPSAGVGDFGFNESQMICAYPPTEEAWIYQIVSMVIMFMASTIVILFCYYNIYKKMQDSTRRTRSTSTSSEHISNVNNVVDKKSTFARMKSHRSANVMVPKTRDIRVAKTLLIVLLTFVICWTPSVTLTVFDKNYMAPDLLRQMFSILALTNSSVNPFIYAWRNRSFRQAYIRIIKCRHWLKPGQYDTEKPEDSTTRL